MIVGVPKEIKNNENRVAITPAGVTEFVKAGHGVVVEKGAGEGSGFSDAAYREAGASIASVQEVWNQADMILKVKEPLESRVRLFQGRTDHLCVLTPCGCWKSRVRADEAQRACHRLRDDSAPRRFSSFTPADE